MLEAVEIRVYRKKKERKKKYRSASMIILLATQSLATEPVGQGHSNPLYLRVSEVSMKNYS